MPVPSDVLDERDDLITNRVVQEDDHTFGVYESPTTYIMIHYVNKGASPDADTSGAHVDVQQMFNTMEVMDRRRINRAQ